jgi:hypothetical protein
MGYDGDSTHAHRIYMPDKNRVAVERNIRFAPTTTVTIYVTFRIGSGRLMH